MYGFFATLRMTQSFGSLIPDPCSQFPVVKVFKEARQMKARTESLISALLLAAILLVSLNAWMAFRSVETLNRSEYWVAHTWQVINAVERVLGSMKDAETGDRGYLLTGDPAYLAPYQRAQHDLPLEFSIARQLTADNPHQQQRLAEMRSIIDKRLGLLQQEITDHRAGHAAAARMLQLDGTGRAEMDRLRALTASMQDEERRLLARRDLASQAARRDAQVTVLLASLLDLALIVLLFWTLRRERRQRVAVTETADRLKELLDISDVGLTQLTVSELTDELLTRLRKTVCADATVLCMWHAGEIEVISAKGIVAQGGRRIALAEDDPIYIAATTNRIIALADSETAAVPLDSLRHATRAVLIIPLTIRGQVIGILLAGRKDSSAFRDRDEQLLSFVADRIALSLDRANAFDAERDARHAAETATQQVQILNTELEERVRLRTAELEATNRELEAFSYSVSHDLRSPLRTIDGFSLALEEDYKEQFNDEARDYLRRVRAGVQRMGALIDALLQLSRITRAEVNPQTVNLSEMAEEVARELRHQNPDRNLIFHIQPGLEATGDAGLLRVAFENLLGNAVKFTSRRPDAVIEMGKSQKTGEFYIRDNGAGFDMQYAGKLFTAFQRLHGEKDFTGSGIGLATVARVIRRHQGAMRAEGAVGSGATFWFTLG